VAAKLLKSGQNPDLEMQNMKIIAKLWKSGLRKAFCRPEAGTRNEQTRGPAFNVIRISVGNEGFIFCGLSAANP
jgi:hypothetical protein